MAARPAISAANAPPAAQPRPGLAVPPRRPTPAPLSVPSPVAEMGSGRHAAGGRPGTSFDAPIHDDAPTPGAMLGMAIGSTPAPSELGYASPRHTGPRATVSPPAVPAAARHTGPVRVPTPIPPSSIPPSAPLRRERLHSSPDLPISVDSGPHRLPHDAEDLADAAAVSLPPQAVLDALPAPAPLPPLPVAAAVPAPVQLPPPAQPAEIHRSSPSIFAPPPPGPLRLPTPASLPQTAGDPSEIDASGEPVVSLRRRMSRARLVLTLAALGGAGGAIWYFLLR